MNPLFINKEGSFQEIAHYDDVEFGQVSLLTINPKCSRGGHYHKVKKEWFCAIHGECEMEIINIKTKEERTVDMGGIKADLVPIMPYEYHTLINNGDEICKVIIIASVKYTIMEDDTFKEY
jgi:dTDP-4-dehydrorhamnose 3,5-epimerase-like enzyme